MDPAYERIAALLPVIKADLLERCNGRKLSEEAINSLVDIIAARIYSTLPFEANDTF